MDQKQSAMKYLSVPQMPLEWRFPTTRYRGSKRKILPWIYEAVKDFSFDSALDLFGGSGVVSSLFKRMGKCTTYNDYLHYNHIAGIALIENNHTRLTDEDLDFILSNHVDIAETGFIADTFKGYYFLASENRWLDQAATNIIALNHFYSGRKLYEKRALAMWALGQACLIKRPFNLFHRKNLCLRTRKAARSFGNKTTWDMPFPHALRRFVKEANEVVFDNGKENKAICANAFLVKQQNYDLVYLDPPYFFADQRDPDYRALYHFLDGLVQYQTWAELIDRDSFNLRLKENGMRWPSRSAEELITLYSSLLSEFRESIIVISHKSNTLIPLGVLRRLLVSQGKRIHMHWKPYTYALNKKNGKPRHNIEWLLIGY